MCVFVFVCLSVHVLYVQLHIHRHPNVMIMATSNITGAIDVAFVDRADIKQYIGPPSIPAIYLILRTCIFELIRVCIISLYKIYKFKYIFYFRLYFDIIVMS